jgi:hypothetical protein
VNEITAYEHGVKDTQAELERVTAQRDALLGAAEAIRQWWLESDATVEPDWYPAYMKLQAAIDNCRED